MPPDRASDRRPELPRALPALRHRRPGPLARFTAGPRLEDALRVATELVASGRRVGLDHFPGRDGDAGAEPAALAGRLAAAGLAASCELTVPVDRLGPADARVLAAAALDAGTGVCLAGAPGAVDALLPELPGVRAAVSGTEPGAERRCRFLAGRPVRLVAGRGAAADRTFARCLNVLLAGGGHVAAAAADPRLVAVVGERAAWYARPSDSWEHVMPYGVHTAEQQRLVASGAVVRVTVPSGSGAAGLLLRRLVGGVA
jgi:proline dehydrogenase